MTAWDAFEMRQRMAVLEADVAAFDALLASSKAERDRLAAEVKALKTELGPAGVTRAMIAADKVDRCGA